MTAIICIPGVVTTNKKSVIFGEGFYSLFQNQEDLQELDNEFFNKKSNIFLLKTFADELFDITIQYHLYNYKEASSYFEWKPYWHQSKEMCAQKE